MWRWITSVKMSRSILRWWIIDYDLWWSLSYRTGDTEVGSAMLVDLITSLCCKEFTVLCLQPFHKDPLWSTTVAVVRSRGSAMLVVGWYWFTSWTSRLAWFMTNVERAKSLQNVKCDPNVDVWPTWCVWLPNCFFDVFALWKRVNALWVTDFSTMWLHVECSKISKS